MKICWDNLEGLVLTKGGNFRDKKKKVLYVYVESCKNCGEPFLKEHGSKGILCSKKCSLIDKNDPFYNKELRNKISKLKTTLKRYYQSRNIPCFDMYAHQIEAYENVQRNMTDRNILDVKCSHCDKWFTPKERSIRVRIQFLKGSRKSKNTFYCKDCIKMKNYYRSRNIPFFDTYAHQIEKYEDVRRNTIDRNVLDVKCIFCNKWFTSTSSRIINRIQSLKGNQKSKNNFSCEYCNKTKGDYWKQNIPFFESYAHQIEKHEDVRKTNKNVLEVRCGYCNNWFVPTLRKVKSKIQSIKGNYKWKNTFYCKDCNINKIKNSYRKRNLPFFDTYAHQLDFCEIVRRNKEDRNILEIKCTYCGKWYMPTLRNIVTRLQFLKGNKTTEGRIYCSEECKQECPIFRQRVFPKGFKVATSREVQPELRQMVLKRDNYKCTKCGFTKNLHCHHIEGIRWEPIESADVDNCITLCKKCHKLVHRIPGCGYHDMKCNEA